MQTLYLTGKDLTPQQLLDASKGEFFIEIEKSIKEKIAAQRRILEEIVKNDSSRKIYGINVGVGSHKDTFVSVHEAETHQLKYLLSHNCGTGNPISEYASRAMMIIRLNSFAHAVSGVSLQLCETLEKCLNLNITPVILEEGSVGASGDLVPLAMLGCVLAGVEDAQCFYKGEMIPAKKAFEMAGINPHKFGFKEAMGLTNGTNFMSGLGTLQLIEAENLLNTASVSAALSLEAIRGEKDAFEEFLINKRPHPGQLKIARQIRSLIAGSRRMSHAAQKVVFKDQQESTATERIQDRYSFRCVPPVHGSVSDALNHLRNTLTLEINSVTDNPLFEEKENGDIKSYSGSLFHGQPLAGVIDYAKIALTTLSLISDKRSFSILNKTLSFGLPPNLAVNAQAGDSGLMLAQYAGAARAADSRVLSTPASIMSLTTSASQEDFVSMGSIGVLHLAKIIHNLTVILAVELLCGLRALQMTNNKEGFLTGELAKLGKGTNIVFEYLNTLFPEPKGDLLVKNDIDKMCELIKSGEIINQVKYVFE